MEVQPVLTAEQQAVVTQAATARVLVTAAAGTGKTHVLVERLMHLVEEHGLFPGTEILVLSFSRAAVAEIRRRISATEGSVSYVGVVTFDSFATRLLAVVDPSESWMSGSYDDRVRLAVEAIQQPEAAQHLDVVKHILIDEIQDLVGPRADLVATLLRSVAAGFTLFGDPAQRIYDHQIHDPDSNCSADLYKIVREEFSDNLVEMTLSKNFRALGERPRRVLDFGPRLQAAEPDYESIRRDLHGFVLDLPTLGDLSTVIPGWRQTPPNSDAILCRTNGQALLILKQLTEAGVTCRIQTAATEAATAAWIAAALLGYESSKIGRTSMLENLAETASEGCMLDPDAKWRLLKLLDSRRSNDLDLRSIAARLVDRTLPLELHEEPGHGVLISTIHRAKGLEFDRVIIMPPDLGADHDECAEETRVLYVALTRARQWIGVMNAPDTQGMRPHRATQRWIHTKFRGKSRFIDAIEFRPEDTEHSLPPGLQGDQANESFAGVQHYIRDSVRPGDEVSLSCDADVSGDDKIYRIEHRGETVGQVSAQCVATMHRTLGTRLPCSVHGLHVDCVATVAGSPAEGGRHGLGRTGLWLAVRMIGMGQLSFDR